MPVSQSMFLKHMEWSLSEGSARKNKKGVSPLSCRAETSMGW